jgi:tetratricopeptide (TPR) repeat protein
MFEIDTKWLKRRTMMQLSNKGNSKKKLIIFPGILFPLILCLFLTRALAGDFLGAEKVVSQINQAIVSERPLPVDSGKEAAKELRQDIESFKTMRAKLSADEAAQQWLNLYDRFWMLPPEVTMKTAPYEYRPISPENEDLPTINYLVSAIPQPEAWESLKKGVLARSISNPGFQESLLRLMVFYLSQDQSNLDKSFSEIEALAKFDGSNYKKLLRYLRADRRWQADRKDDESAAERFDAYLQSLYIERPEGRRTILVPDLVFWVGEKEAEKIILKAIAIPGVSLKIPSGDKTLALAKRLVKEHASDLIEPQWGLVTRLDDIELYETMASRFPEKVEKGEEPPDVFQVTDRDDQYRYRHDETEGDRSLARIYYIFGLIAKRRVEEAIGEAKRMEAESFDAGYFKDTWQSFEKMRYSKELMQFCTGLLMARPAFPLWNSCGLIAASDQESQTLITIITNAADKTDLSLDLRLKIREKQVELLLAMDRVEDAVTLLGETVKIDIQKETPPIQLAAAQVKFKLLSRMCKLGKLLGRPELIRESEELYLANLQEFGQRMSPNFWGDHFLDSSTDTMIEAHLDRGEYAQAEKILVEAMQSFLKTLEFAGLPFKRDLVISGGMLAEYLSRLVEIYDRAGRYEEVLILMEETPWWGAVDFIDLSDDHKELSPIVARALHHAGRDPEAVNILKGHLYGYPEDDAAYQALIAITGPSLIPWLDELYRRDRFEERPLIWKAELLRQQGKLEEAEATVRQALKVDPTDGEQEAGDRVRAYAVLAEILKARGKEEDAAFFGRVVESVRTAEKGDEFTEAGLIQRSLSLYEEAAESFVDAYCVQWRLAERLSAMGNLEEARKHYEIAFERMPEQFGQVASFCFGCEGVFTHRQSRNIAEQVLTRFSFSLPQKPQVQFLMGQLRESQGRKNEAYRHFRKAIKLDPEYLDAWEEAYRLRSDVFLTQAEIDEIALSILRLDPMNRHGCVVPGEISDLKGLWSIYEESGRNNIVIPNSLLPLTASKENLDTMFKNLGEGEWFYLTRAKRYQERRRVPEVGDAVTENQFIHELLNFATSNGFQED